MEMPPDTLKAVGVNELFVTVTVDSSFTTEQAVVGRIDGIHILNVVRAAQMFCPSRKSDFLVIFFFLKKSVLLCLFLSRCTHSLGILLFNVFHQRKLVIMTKRSCFMEVLFTKKLHEQ